jgi:2',3'-cyclic-nucleotide 2'-phosphodiesterase (5'-nucleotidase family)
VTRIRLFAVFILNGFLFVACETGSSTLRVESQVKVEPVTLTVLYTSDEHGWMAGEKSGQGVAELAGLWAAQYSGRDAVLILSGGDNWTGPAISTWFEGEGMVEVMNVMGYDPLQGVGFLFPEAAGLLSDPPAGSTSHG